MTQNVPLVDGDIAVQSFFQAVQEVLSGIAVNFEVTLLNPTTVQVAASTGDAQVSLSIDGQYRYITATINRAHPPGAAGVYDLYVTALANNGVTGAPAGDDYSFALAIVPSGATPAGVAISRLMRRIQWDGSAIASIARLNETGALTVDGTLKARTALTSYLDTVAQIVVGNNGGVPTIYFGLAQDTSLYRSGAALFGAQSLDLTGTLKRPLLSAFPTTGLRDGMEILLQTSAMKAAGVAPYELRYDPTAGTYPWYVISAQPFVVEQDAGVTSGAVDPFAALPGVPTISLPFGGDWLARVEATIYVPGGASSAGRILADTVAPTAAAGTPRAAQLITYSNIGALAGSAARSYLLLDRAAGASVKAYAQISGAAGSATFSAIRLTAVPRQLG